MQAVRATPFYAYDTLIGCTPYSAQPIVRNAAIEAFLYLDNISKLSPTGHLCTFESSYEGPCWPSPLSVSILGHGVGSLSPILHSCAKQGWLYIGSSCREGALWPKIISQERSSKDGFIVSGKPN